MKNGVVLTSYFTQKPHPNDPRDAHVIGRQPNGYIPNNSFEYIEKWYNSLSDLKINSIIFHDDLSEKFTKKYTNDYINFIKVERQEVHYSNNDWRFFCFKEYLDSNLFDWVVHADVSDVVAVKNPSDLFLEFPEFDFYACKDAIKLNQFPYLQFHNSIGWKTDFKCLGQHDKWDLINMGVIGGSYENMKLFYDTFCEIREDVDSRISDPNSNSINLNMWICQYLLRWILKDKKTLIGEPFTSEFKKYQDDRKDVWFIHK